MENKKTIRNRAALRVGILLLIVAVVLGIFFLKKASSEPEVVVTPAADTGESLPFEITRVDMDNILSYGLPVMIDFGADECGPCQSMAADLEQMHREAQGTAVVHYIDVWVNPSEAAAYPVRVVPTQMFVLPDGSPWQPPEGLADEIGTSFSSYTNPDTGEPAYTVHEGVLTLEQMRAILADMGAQL